VLARRLPHQKHVVVELLDPQCDLPRRGRHFPLPRGDARRETQPDEKGHGPAPAVVPSHGNLPSGLPRTTTHLPRRPSYLAPAQSTNRRMIDEYRVNYPRAVRAAMLGGDGPEPTERRRNHDLRSRPDGLAGGEGLAAGMAAGWRTERPRGLAGGPA